MKVVRMKTLEELLNAKKENNVIEVRTDVFINPEYAYKKRNAWRVRTKVVIYENEDWFLGKCGEKYGPRYHTQWVIDATFGKDYKENDAAELLLETMKALEKCDHCFLSINCKRLSRSRDMDTIIQFLNIAFERAYLIG